VSQLWRIVIVETTVCASLNHCEVMKANQGKQIPQKFREPISSIALEHTQIEISANSALQECVNCTETSDKL